MTALHEAYLVNDVQRLAELAEHCRSTARQFVCVDGFAGTGKTTLAEGLARTLEAPLISLDEFLADDPECMSVQSYIERLDRTALLRAIANAPSAVIEGALLRDALQGALLREDTEMIYVALCSRPTSDRLIWHDGLRIAEGDGPGADWFTKSETAYHRQFLPHEDADAVAIRIE